MQIRNHLFIVGKEVNKNTKFFSVWILDWLVCLNKRPTQVHTQLCGCAAAAFTISLLTTKSKEKIKICLP